MCIFETVKIFKHILSLTLAFTFFLSVSGINVYKHYCGDFLEEVSVYIQSNPCADEGGEDACSKDKETDCCDDEVEFLQLDIDLVQAQSQKVEFSNNQLTLVLFAAIPMAKESSNQMESISERAPPNFHKIPIYKRLSRYTLYG